MPEWIVEQLVLEFSKRSKFVSGSKVLILGFTFKENCKDIRNTKVIKMINAMKKYGISPFIHDPIADKKEVKDKYAIDLIKTLNATQTYSSIVVAQRHDIYLSWDIEKWKSLLEPNGFIFDIKGIVPRELNPLRI